MTEKPLETNEQQPCGLLRLPLELRVIVLKDIFQDFLDRIDTIPFTRPTAGELYQPRFDKSHNIALCKRVLALLHTSRRLRLDSFAVYMPLVLDFWQAVRAEARELRRERERRGDGGFAAEKAAMERHYLNALRAEGASQIFLSLAQAEANSS
jgi:hypothetical protein